MESCEILRKSVLKKSNLSVINKDKRVTFCSTVKVFVGELGPNQKNIVDFQLNCVEVNIVDKSSDDTINIIDVSKHDDCNASDFLVHKVIYEDALEQDSDDVDTDALSEEADESPVLFETNTDEEGLQFVVHKVTDHEDDLIQQELDLVESDANTAFSEEIECDGDIVNKLSKLSLENILAHDKIIAFIDQNTLGLSSLLKSHINATEKSLPPSEDPSKEEVDKTKMCAGLKSPELVLSPPLQELSLDKIVRAQSDNSLCELDISPLNSIQETDSDSDASSEGTMIMMTTEESEKNEQHIRESLQKYESMKKEKKVEVKTINILPQSGEEVWKPFVKLNGDDNLRSGPLTRVASEENTCDNRLNKNSKQETCVGEKDCAPDNLEIASKCMKSSSPATCNSVTSSCDKSYDVCVTIETKRTSLTPMNSIPNSCYWDKSLASIEIPKDVREWKITSSPEKSAKPDSRTANSTYVSRDEQLSPRLKMHPYDFHPVPHTSPKSDELESFVLASKERVQRIRKRYSEKAPRKIENSPGRVSKPRFGSTAEILQLVQRQNQHPLIAFSNRGHVSWPCNEAVASSGMHIQGRRPLKHVPGCQSFAGEHSAQSSFSSYTSEDSGCSSNCDHDSVSSCPSIFYYERVPPEGASPPRSLSEDSSESHSEDNPSNIVYFSMKV